MRNDLKGMKVLLELGANPDPPYLDEVRRGMTLLHEACMKGELDKAKLLLSYGANFNLRCQKGRGALDFVKLHYEGKSNRKKETLKQLLYKYTVKAAVMKRA